MRCQCAKGTSLRSDILSSQLKELILRLLISPSINMSNRIHTQYYGIFNDSYPPIIDGVTLTVQNYVIHLMERGVNPCVVTPWNPVSTPSDCRVMKFFSLPIANRKPYRYGYPKIDPFIWSRLRRTRFKILHSHCPFSSGRLAVYVKKHQNVPLIGTFHSKYKSDLEHSFHRVPWMVPIIMKRILNFFNACDQVWIPQAQVEETVRQYGYRGELVTVPNGNDMADVPERDLAQRKSRARALLNIRPEEISLLFVGQHIWEKGIGIIVEALHLVKDEIPFVMNFIGDGYAAEDLKNIVRKLGLQDSVKVHGLITDRAVLRNFYAAADLFLFPSFYDNAPLVVREAAAFRTPSVIPVGSTAAEVISDGRNGFLVSRTPADYAAVIRRLYSDRDLLNMAGAGARDSLVKGWNEVFEEIFDRYTTIINTYK